MAGYMTWLLYIVWAKVFCSECFSVGAEVMKTVVPLFFQNARGAN
jgi:hypothetical protein